MIIKKLFVGLIALTFGTLAFASGDTFVQPPLRTTSFVPGIYVGVQAGYGRTGWDNLAPDNIASGGVIQKYSITGSNAFAGRVFVGYDFHPNFAIEAGYTQFFNDTEMKTTADFFSPSGQVTSSATVTSNPKYDYAIDLVGKIKAHLIGNAGLYAKAGVDYIHIQADNEFKVPGIPQGKSTSKSSEYNVIYGVGAFYDITQHLTADLSWTRYNGDSNLGDDYIPAHDLFAAGASWKFNLA